jgi:glycerophosphoryl diester phosphodiesterase
MRNIIITLSIILISVPVIAQNYYIAHRGASYLAPENTVASAKLAWELGADAVEIDVHLSADNRVMVIHDSDTKKTSMGESNYVISETKSDVLRKLDVGSFKDDKYIGEKIPFVEEILETVPKDKTLVIEIKCGEEVLPALVKAIDQSGKADQLVFISFGWETIQQTKKTFPLNKCYYLRMNPVGLKTKMKEAAEFGLDGVNLYHKIINKNVMKLSDELSLEVLTWTVDDPETVKRLNKLGVYKITTNRPAWLKEQMK